MQLTTYNDTCFPSHENDFIEQSNSLINEIFIQYLTKYDPNLPGHIIIHNQIKKIIKAIYVYNNCSLPSSSIEEIFIILDAFLKEAYQQDFYFELKLTKCDIMNEFLSKIKSCQNNDLYMHLETIDTIINDAYPLSSR